MGRWFSKTYSVNSRMSFRLRLSTLWVPWLSRSCQRGRSHHSCVSAAAMAWQRLQFSRTRTSPSTGSERASRALLGKRSDR
jgi:hypothetical protein